MNGGQVNALKLVHFNANFTYLLKINNLNDLILVKRNLTVRFWERLLCENERRNFPVPVSVGSSKLL